MGSCQSISHESHNTQSNSTAITVKEKPTEEETKECQPTTIASNDNQNDKQNDKEIATTTQPDVTANHVNQTNGAQSSDPDQHTQSSEQQSTPHVEPIPTETLATSSTTDNEVKPEQTATNSAPPQPTNDAASEAFDEEFKSTVKTVLLLLLDRLVRTMEYESFMFQELALATGLPNYMELFDYREFEKFLRDNFAIPSSPAPMQNDADVKHVSQYFSLFLSLAQNGTSSSSTRSFPSRVTFTQRLQTLCSSTSSKLLAWCESPHASSEVKEHFLFFSKALEFARGDLINQPKLLYQNIDEITA